MFTGGSMEVEREEFPWGVFLRSGSVQGRAFHRTAISDEVYGVIWENGGLRSPAEARAFAQRIIAVADAVEAELKGPK